MKFFVLILLTFVGVCCLVNSYQFLNVKRIKCRYMQQEYLTYNIPIVHNNEIPKEESNFEPQICESYASFTSLNNEDLQKLIGCTDIDFSGNDFLEIVIHFGEEFEVIEELNFDNNKLTEFPENFLKNLTNLRKFSAKNNLLESLDENFLTYNKGIKLIDFSRNRLRKISPIMIANSMHLQKASFLDNLCVNAVYPEVSLRHLTMLIARNCDEEKKMIEYVKELVKKTADLDDSKIFSSLLQNSSMKEEDLPTLAEVFKNLTEMSEISSKIPNELADDPAKLVEIFKNTFKQQENIDAIKNNLINKSNSIDNSTLSLHKSGINEIFTINELIELLFWMIIPIALILFVILIVIIIAVYNKYYVYSLETRQLGEIRSLSFRGV